MPPSPPATTGRPRNAAATRERIIAAARPLFAERGFEATTVHAIARSAQVSPNLITRYFGGKDGMFLAASDVRFAPAVAFDGPRSSIGERVAHNLVARWAELGMNDPLPILLRSAGGQPAVAATLADFLSENFTGPMITQLLAYGMSRQDAAEQCSVQDAKFEKQQRRGDSCSATSPRWPSCRCRPLMWPPSRPAGWPGSCLRPGRGERAGQARRVTGDSRGEGPVVPGRYCSAGSPWTRFLMSRLAASMNRAWS